MSGYRKGWIRGMREFTDALLDLEDGARALHREHRPEGVVMIEDALGRLDECRAEEAAAEEEDSDGQ